MKRFGRYLEEVAIISAGYKAPKHTSKYIEPFIGKKNTHTLAKDVGNIKAGDKVSVLSTRAEGDKHFASIKHEGTGEVHEVRTDRLHKPAHVVKNIVGAAGFAKESALADRLKARGLMDPKTPPAGNTGGHDFHIINKKKKRVYGGAETDNVEGGGVKLGGESKIGLSAKMGSIALRYHPERGWYIPEHTEKKKPRFSEAVRRATVDGKPILQHLNEHWGDLRNETSPRSLVSDPTGDLHPLHAYMRDHGVDVLHIHSHGTFRGGESEYRDRTGAGLPAPTGNGRFNVYRERADSPSFAVSFYPYKPGFSKSSIDIMKNDADLERVAKRLGH